MLRRSFLPPIAEHGLAAELLSKAADALLLGDDSTCSRCLRDADFWALRQFAYTVCGPINPTIHRQSRNPDVPVLSLAGPRMPSAKVMAQVYVRDGFHCRYCSCRVILPAARRVFQLACPLAARWGRANKDKHFGLSALLASLDHIVPFRRGGGHEIHNLVTACGPCQFGRNVWTLEEVEIDDPRKYPPILDGWDGLGRIVNRSGSA